MTESFVSAKRLGVFDVLMTELETSQKAMLKFAQDSLQQMPPKAHRWIGEMNELAATYQGIGLTPRMLAGAADMYRDVSQTTLGHESPKTSASSTVPLMSSSSCSSEICRAADLLAGRSPCLSTPDAGSMMHRFTWRHGGR